MTENKDNDTQWSSNRHRDDTPSFIRNVESKSSILHPSSRDSLPILAVPRSVRIWQKVRWPLAIFTVALILIIVGAFTHKILEKKNVAQRLEDSMIGETFAQVQVMYESNRVLSSLSSEYPDYQNVQAAFAWNTILLSRLFNEQQSLLPAAQNAFNAIENDSAAIALAARAGRAILKSQYDDAAALIKLGVSQNNREPRLHLTSAWLDIARGNLEAGLKKLTQMRKQFPDYLPPLYTLIEVSVSQGDNLAIATYSTELLTTSTGNLYGALTSLLVRLPLWNSDPLSDGELKKIRNAAEELTVQVKDAPEVLKTYTSFIEGRLAMQEGNYPKAISILKRQLNDKYQLNTLAWYGKAVMKQNGPNAVLEALKSAGENPRVEIYDLRARAQLELYDVQEAEKALRELSKKSSFDLNELQWILAVRKGDLTVAKSRLPEHISTRLVSVVLEMYELLQKLGDKEGLYSLTAAMKNGTLSECADAIENWHENRLQKIFHQFSSPTDGCIAAFALRVMRNSYPPDKLKFLSEKAVADVNDLRTRVDRIHVIWKTQGYMPALKELDELAARKTSSGPLLVAIASEYMEMGKNNQARELLASTDYPEAIALYIKSLQALNKGKKAQIVLSKAMQNTAYQHHPALINLAIEQKYEAGKIGEVVQDVDAVIENAGAWSSEIAALKAMAMSAMGERGDADRYLTSFIKPAGRIAGLAESWEVQKSIIRINLRRGGNFMFKAVAYTIELYKSKIEDPEVTFSYGVESQRQGNSRGAVRYFNDAIEMDPAFFPAYKELQDLDEMTDELRDKLKKFRPNANL